MISDSKTEAVFKMCQPCERQCDYVEGIWVCPVKDLSSVPSLCILLVEYKPTA